MNDIVSFIAGRPANSVERRSPNLVSHLEVCVSRETTPVEEFYVVSEATSNGHESKHFVSDVYMLFNQKRLDKMTGRALTEYLESSVSADDGLGELRSKIPVDRICDFVKSRYLQSPAELRAWTSYLVNEYRTSVNDIQAMRNLDKDLDGSPFSDSGSNNNNNSSE